MVLPAAADCGYQPYCKIRAKAKGGLFAAFHGRRHSEFYQLIKMNLPRRLSARIHKRPDRERFRTAAKVSAARSMSASESVGCTQKPTVAGASAAATGFFAISGQRIR